MLRSSFVKLVSNHLRASFSTTAAEAPVIFEYDKKVCKVILNKPKALNALDLEMIRILKPEAELWNTTSDARVNHNLFELYFVNLSRRLLSLKELVVKHFVREETSNLCMKPKSAEQLLKFTINSSEKNTLWILPLLT